MCNSPSTIFCFLNSPLHLLESTPRDLMLLLVMVQSFPRFGFRENAMLRPVMLASALIVELKNVILKEKKSVNMILFSQKESYLASICCFGCGRLSTECILKLLQSSTKSKPRRSMEQPALLFQSYSGFSGCFFASLLTPQLTRPEWCTQFLFSTRVHSSEP